MYIIYTVSCAKLITVQEMKLKVTTEVALSVTLTHNAWKGNLFLSQRTSEDVTTIIRNILPGIKSLIEFERSHITPNIYLRTAHLLHKKISPKFKLCDLLSIQKNTT